MIRRWDKSKPPTGPFALNRDCPQAQGLVAWWPIGGPSGSGVSFDMFGGNHATGATSGATLMRSGEHGLTFNGSSNTLYRAQSVITSNPVSLHVFAIIASPSTTQAIFSIGKASTDRNELSSLLLVAGKAWAMTQYASTNKQSIGATTLSANVPYGIGGIWGSNASRRVYLNGVADAAAETTTVVVSGIDAVRFGRRVNDIDGQYFGGTLGEAAAWNIAVNEDIFKRINSPDTRFELWYPLRSRKWFSAAAATAPTITALSAIGITATSAQPRISYA